MNDQWQPPGADPQQLAAFQRIWGDTFTKIMQVGLTFTPDSAPPDLLREMRSGLFKALSQSWEQFLRSPEFMEGTKQWMDSAVSFRKMSNDFLSKARQDSQGVARDDVDAIARAVRQMERRLSEKLEQLTARVEDLQERTNGTGSGGTAARPKKRVTGRAAKPRRGTKG